jgi:hypothetical protein
VKILLKADLTAFLLGEVSLFNRNFVSGFLPMPREIGVKAPLMARFVRLSNYRGK